MVTFYDRDKLMDYCRETVLGNLVEGILFVTIVVFIFMLDWRSTVIVSIIIPLSLLFAFICLKLKGMSANLLSMGAIDFGIIVDGAIVMMENILRRREEEPEATLQGKDIMQSVRQVTRPVFFGILVIIIAYLPLFAFQRIEYKLFSPMVK